MSEEILRALVQLFAITTKQDGVSMEEREFVINFFKQELALDSVDTYTELYDKFSGWKAQQSGEDFVIKAPTVKDSVKTLGLCKKINKTLEQKQKVVVLMKMLEVVFADDSYSHHEIEVINTISMVFNIPKAEHTAIESFAKSREEVPADNPMLLNLDNTTEHGGNKLFHGLDGKMIFVHIPSVDMFFVRYFGVDLVTLNGFSMNPGRVYLFSNGSILRSKHGDVLYYSDLVSYFNPTYEDTRLSFHADIEELRFPSGDIGLRSISIKEGPGKLVGIMGASGAGKTTLLNVLAGLVKPTKGKIEINGFDIHNNREELRGVIGYVSQDDLLIEELTVYQNLYYNAKLCFANLSEEDLYLRVMEVLKNLGLDQRKDLRVGTVLDKTISGGQRKRLNIALELIREPGVLFLDEPTSGLSSRDSENVIDLLKELSMKGKLIFTVIHQPSSDIYKMFDKMYILDVGGFPAYYGNPVDAITYFKGITNQVDKQRGQCELCGNVNPEKIFNIIEAKVVDEYGQLTGKRKIEPQQWFEAYKKSFSEPGVPKVNEKPAKSLHIPNKFMQTWIFTIRDLLSKVSNRQYLLINLLEAPVLAALLAFVIRYRDQPTEGYIYRFNENIPAFILMAIIVALFMGMTVSAEEIIRDRKILKRESFLNLSWNSYLLGKMLILFTLSLVQTFSFVLIGNIILEIPGNFFGQWMILFACGAFANLIGLNISSAFKSAVTVYILIPLLLIPQMIFSGVIFDFEKLNNSISSRGKVPVVADFMASRWAYEAYAVDQFINNKYQRPYYPYEKEESISDIKSAYVPDILESQRTEVERELSSDNPDIKVVNEGISIINRTLTGEKYSQGLEEIVPLDPQNFSDRNNKLKLYIQDFQDYYQRRFNETVKAKEVVMMNRQKEADYDLSTMKNRYFNESLSDLVRNLDTKERVVIHEGRLIQQINPIFHEPQPNGPLDYRAHFFAPVKYFAGTQMSTFSFNLMVIWMMTLILYLALYFEVLAKFIRWAGNFNFKKR